MKALIFKFHIMPREQALRENARARAIGMVQSGVTQKEVAL